MNVNVTPTSHDLASDTPEIRTYKKRFNSEILSAALWGVSLLIGTENGLMLLDRSEQGKVYQLISRRRFQQMEVLEGQNILVTISGKKNRVRVDYHKVIVRILKIVETTLILYTRSKAPIAKVDFQRRMIGITSDQGFSRAGDEHARSRRENQVQDAPIGILAGVVLVETKTPKVGHDD